MLLSPCKKIRPHYLASVRGRWPKAHGYRADVGHTAPATHSQAPSGYTASYGRALASSTHLRGARRWAGRRGCGACRRHRLGRAAAHPTASLLPCSFSSPAPLIACSAAACVCIVYVAARSAAHTAAPPGGPRPDVHPQIAVLRDERPGAADRAAGSHTTCGRRRPSPHARRTRRWELGRVPGLVGRSQRRLPARPPRLDEGGR